MNMWEWFQVLVLLKAAMKGAEETGTLLLPVRGVKDSKGRRWDMEIKGERRPKEPRS